MSSRERRFTFLEPLRRAKERSGQISLERLLLSATAYVVHTSAENKNKKDSREVSAAAAHIHDHECDDDAPTHSSSSSLYLLFCLSLPVPGA